MTILVAGATGATGRLLVAQLLERGEHVRALVRSAGRLPAELSQHDHLALIEASLLDLSDAELAQHVRGCGAVASCLGHNLSLKGIFGHPRRLVTEATRRLCAAVEANQPSSATKFVLMNTAGNHIRESDEPISFAQKCVIGLIRLLVPPHRDNEEAADHLRRRSDGALEWVVVRPDTLIDEDEVTAYEVHPSPTRSALFNPGKISRINVAHFMAELCTNDETWRLWQGQLPVIYNRSAN